MIEKAKAKEVELGDYFCTQEQTGWKSSQNSVQSAFNAQF